MFDFLLWTTMVIALGGALYAYAGSRDVFHPLMFLSPMLIFLYGWMPLKLDASGGLDGYFQSDQLVFVQFWNALGVLCLVIGCLSVGARIPRATGLRQHGLETERAGKVLLWGGAFTGLLGLAAWAKGIVNVGGLRDAFSTGGLYSGGWDDSGYIRDGTLLMYPGFLLVVLAIALWRARIISQLLLVLFMAPWIIQAWYMSKRGPTFMIAVVLAMTWYMNRGTRPPLLLTVGAGLLVGLLMLFLVTNRGNIYMGSDAELSTEVTDIVERPDTGNEYIYGAGSMLSAEQQLKFYQGRRYLAEVLIRPIPSAVWPTKYEDFGLPELTHNAGTAEGLNETLGWSGADGAAPGFIADLWVEFRWFSMPVLWLLGRLYGRLWRKAHLQGGPWIAQYIIVAALSVYLVMQTMEAVIFRSLLMSLPLWLTWYVAQRRPATLPASIPLEVSYEG
jgi:hypothetical protein